MIIITIKIENGNLYCSICNKVINKNDIYKINEFGYQVICSNCIDKIGISKVSYVSCSTDQKSYILDIIMSTIKCNGNIILDQSTSIKDTIKQVVGTFNKNL